mmetsp:Transcript_94096/g.263386  ORF Transcript_94096/g.263386 Transcript_94096/m.263386 type:complete len:356 (+) Transcript_94096:507-1574(+)
MDEAPLQLALLQLALVAVEVAHLLHLEGDLRGHVADLVVHVRLAPLLVLERLHDLQHPELHDLLREDPVGQEVPQHGEREAHHLLGGADLDDVPDLHDHLSLLEEDRPLRLERQHPQREDAAVQVLVGRSSQVDRDDPVGDAGDGPDLGAELGGLQQVHDRLQHAQVAADVRGLHGGHHSRDVLLREEPRPLADDRGEDPGGLVRAERHRPGRLQDGHEGLHDVDLLLQRRLEGAEGRRVLAQHVVQDHEHPLDDLLLLRRQRLEGGLEDLRVALHHRFLLHRRGLGVQQLEQGGRRLRLGVGVPIRLPLQDLLVHVRRRLRRGCAAVLLDDGRHLPEGSAGAPLLLLRTRAKTA